MRTSLEIVPHSTADLDAAVALIQARYPRIDTVNVPDRANCDLRSTDAVHHLRGRIAHRIPHLRSCDFDETSVDGLLEVLIARDIDEVIVVAGDKADTAHGFEPTALIRALASPRTSFVGLRGARPAPVSRRRRPRPQHRAEARSGRLRILHATAVRPARHRSLRDVARRRDDVLGFESGDHRSQPALLAAGQPRSFSVRVRADAELEPELCVAIPVGDRRPRRQRVSDAHQGRYRTLSRRRWQRALHSDYEAVVSDSASQSTSATPARRNATYSSVCHGSPGAAPLTC